MYVQGLEPPGNALGIVPDAHNAGGNWGGAELCEDPARPLLQSDTCQVCRTRVDYQAGVFYSLSLGSLTGWLGFFLCNQTWQNLHLFSDKGWGLF